MRGRRHGEGGVKLSAMRWESCSEIGWCPGSSDGSSLEQACELSVHSLPKWTRLGRSERGSSASLRRLTRNAPRSSRTATVTAMGVPTEASTSQQQLPLVTSNSRLALSLAAPPHGSFAAGTTIYPTLELKGSTEYTELSLRLKGDTSACIMGKERWVSTRPMPLRLARLRADYPNSTTAKGNAPQR